MRYKKINYIEPVESYPWWNSQRLRYNIWLGIAGLISFISYAIIVEFLLIPTKEEAEITAFTIIFQAFGYLIMMFIANICYFIGPILENSIKPKNVNVYRKITYNLGLWFSVTLPLFVPVFLLLNYLLK